MNGFTFLFSTAISYFQLIMSLLSLENILQHCSGSASWPRFRVKNNTSSSRKNNNHKKKQQQQGVLIIETTKERMQSVHGCEKAHETEKLIYEEKKITEMDIEERKMEFQESQRNHSNKRETS
jgi:hypothetical protein